MRDIWLTSDTHFYHDKEFLYEPRGFSSVKEMNEVLIENWNKVVKPNDIVYHLGDVFMGDYDANLLKKLNGSISLIQGNHDTVNKIGAMYLTNKIVDVAVTSTILTIRKFHFFLCHYPVLTANFDDDHFNRHVINLHGHTHQKKNWLFVDNPFMYHVGVDSHNYTPVNIEEIIVDIRNAWTEMAHLNITPHGIYNNY